MVDWVFSSHTAQWPVQDQGICVASIAAPRSILISWSDRSTLVSSTLHAGQLHTPRWSAPHSMLVSSTLHAGQLHTPCWWAPHSMLISWPDCTGIEPVPSSAISTCIFCYSPAIPVYRLVCWGSRNSLKFFDSYNDRARERIAGPNIGVWSTFLVLHFP